MPSYESIFILKPDLKEEEIEKNLNKLKDVIINKGGIINRLEKWGKKRLAYQVKKQRMGNYIFIVLEGPPNLIPELEKNCKLNEDIIKYITIKQERGDTFKVTFEDGKEDIEEKKLDIRQERFL
ncbi:MAG: 30S ribosomal protein S6 [Nitrospinae bacterium RIFCSPLOWO2_12_FULL_45_22]|nr:MAG: 30S ribosomal protein S6 [Nitrospinae bacterium RIFCSPLOWO2_12_FULL_45_22]